jgi:Fe-S-cluster containining protein
VTKAIGAAKSTDAPECTACGACCFSTLPEYVRVFGVDLDRMDDRARAYTDFTGNRCFMRLEDGRCTALVIDPSGPRFTCAIYEMRPDVCRSLERGSGACAADRHEKRERPLLAVERLLQRPASPG